MKQKKRYCKLTHIGFHPRYLSRQTTAQSVIRLRETNLISVHSSQLQHEHVVRTSILIESYQASMLIQPTANVNNMVLAPERANRTTTIQNCLLQHSSYVFWELFTISHQCINPNVLCRWIVCRLALWTLQYLHKKFNLSGN